MKHTTCRKVALSLNDNPFLITTVVIYWQSTYLHHFRYFLSAFIIFHHHRHHRRFRIGTCSYNPAGMANYFGLLNPWRVTRPFLLRSPETRDCMSALHPRPGSVRYIVNRISVSYHHHQQIQQERKTKCVQKSSSIILTTLFAT